MCYVFDKKTKKVKRKATPIVKGLTPSEKMANFVKELMKKYENVAWEKEIHLQIKFKIDKV